MRYSLAIRLVSLVLFGCLSASGAYNHAMAQDGSSNIVAREVTGYGSTRELAVVNGLIEAIQQIKGVKVSSVKELKSSLIEMMKERNGVENSSSDFRAMQQNDILSKTEGYVKSYKVLNIERRTDGLGWDALLRVEVPVYLTPGISPHSRIKVAVMPFRNLQGQYRSIESFVPSDVVSKSLVQKLVTEFTQTRKFSVLDRDYTEEYLKEKNLLLSPDASINELSKIGEVLGVDYMVVGNITDFNISNNQYVINVTSEKGYDLRATMLVEYRILVMATRQIKWSDSVSVSLREADFQDLVVDFRQDAVEGTLIGVVAKKIVIGAMDNIYPIRVVKVDSHSTLILNQGGVSLSVGELLDVYNSGEIVKDPYTGESLGAIERRAATVEVTRVTSKISYAEILQGDATDVRNGAICRRVMRFADQPEISKHRNSNVKTLKKGGVALPYDTP
jgi:curli biogenesis system outer membrane secretion channel CsgG